ncbi:MAG: FGGY-family carbohydrate kinase [Anaerolineales bacterium]|nr:FGGY-family carbohydrate kinase [Anaerolineales bacterium]
MPNEKYTLAIDLGSSGPKVGLVSTRGEILASEFEKVETLFLPNGGIEQRPDDWWQAILRAAQRVIRQNPVPAEDILAVNCASLYSTTLAVGRDGRPLMNAIFWMDTRGARYAQKATNGIFKIQGYGIGKLLTWLRLTGGVPTPSGKDSLAHILFVKHELPEIYRQTYKFLEPKDYINMRLTGQVAATYDSVNLHWLTDNRDIYNILWDNRLLGMAGVEREKLPELRRTLDVLGPLRAEAARELGLSEKTLVVAGATDAQSAAVGSGAVRDYEAHLYLGTSSWISCHVPFKKTDLLHSMASLPSAIPGKYYIANEQECAGACLNFLRDNLLYAEDELRTGAPPGNIYEVFDRMAEQAPAGSEGVIFTPWLVGERTPVEDALIRGGFFNLSLKTDRRVLVRAVFEGVAYNARWLLECVERFAGRRMEPINMIGGGAQSDIWCQIHADVLKRTIRQVKDPIRAGLRGAAFLATVALGLTTFDEIAARLQITNTFQANPANRRIHDQLFKEFVNLYQANRPICARLNS